MMKRYSGGVYSIIRRLGLAAPVVAMLTVGGTTPVVADDPTQVAMAQPAQAAVAPAATLSLSQFGLKEGDVVSEANLSQHADLVPPGIEWGVRQGWRLNVTEPKPIIIPRAYREATEKHAPQVKLGKDGLTLDNYVAGRPFPHLDPADPDVALKIMWNYYYNFAPTDDLAIDLFEADTGGVGKNQPMKVERHYIVGHYRKLNYNGRLYIEPKPLMPNPEDVRFKESIHPIVEPYDMKGIGGTFYRYNDPSKQDDSWIYLPQLRRVRRLSTAQRSDSLFGQDTDIDSYAGYNGHIAWMNYKFLGERAVLGALHARNVPAKWQETEDWLFDDQWEPRKVWVIEATSKFNNYAYGKRVLYIDQEAYLIPHSDIYDKAGELWKAWVNLFGIPTIEVDPKDDNVLYGAAAVIYDTQLSHCTKSAMPSQKSAGRKSIFINKGQAAGVTEEFFTVAHLIATGR
jgi:hypothetical protein